jgi:hypothetical protein
MMKSFTVLKISNSCKQKTLSIGRVRKLIKQLLAIYVFIEKI